jgi:TrmH family RNA methyltransferase
VKEITPKMIRFLNSLKDPVERKKSGLAFAEGENILNEVLKNKIKIHTIILTKNFYEKSKIFLHSIKDEISIYIVDESLLQRISTTKTAYNCITIFYVKNNIKTIDEFNINDVKEKSFLMGFENLQDPGNLGTIIRTSVAFYFKNIFLFADSVDPFSPKVIRSSAGAILQLDNIFLIKNDEYDSFFTTLKSKNIKVIGASRNERKSFSPDENLLLRNIPALIIFGNEGMGISKGISKFCDSFLSIEQNDQVESLNVAIAHSIISYFCKKAIDRL